MRSFAIAALLAVAASIVTFLAAFAVVVAPAAHAETMAGAGGVILCKGKDDLREVVRAVQAKDEKWQAALEATVCAYIAPDTKVVVIEEYDEALVVGGNIVKARAFITPLSVVGYASRSLIVGKAD